jgi:hypothetical protein
MDYNPTVNILAFNDKIRLMNQTRAMELRMTAIEANNLQADITAMLAEIARLGVLNNQQNEQIVQISIDGGGFQ